MSSGFVHCHVHSEYALVDSTVRIKDLVKGCAEAGMPAVALTDDSNLFGLVKFYRAARAAGVKPVAGCDLWLAASRDNEEPSRLTVLCQNHAGYLNLSRLISRAWLDGQSGGHARIQAAWLEQHSDGLILLAGRDSAIARACHDGHLPMAHQQINWLQRRFPERLYLEITRCGREGEEEWLQTAVALAGEAGLPLLASNDVRFVQQSDFDAHEARVCIHDGRVLADPRRPHDYSPEQYLKSPAQMAELFADLPEALENSMHLARRCNLVLEFGTYHLPQFPVPDGHDLDSFIRASAREGLEARLATHGAAPGHAPEDYFQRLEHELDVINQMGFPGYFLIVSDFIRWAKNQDIPVGPGRGSGAGSVVAWSLKITDIDPLKFNLLFERFLNPERVSMPDFDIDFCMDRRDRVIDYVADKYGRDHVSQIITYGSMAAKAVLRDCGRVLGMPYGQVDRIAKLIPMRPLDLTLADALGRSEKSQQDRERIVGEFCALYSDDEEARTLIDLALKLEGLTRNAGKHAGGVVIAPRPLTEFAPLYAEPGGGGVVTQYDKDDVEAVGLVKFDFLGLRTLTIIDWAVKAVNGRRLSADAAHGSGSAGQRPDVADRDSGLGTRDSEEQKPKRELLDISKIPLDDAATFKLFREARTVAIFQFESPGMQRLLKDALPDKFEDLIALVALYRPGPMDLIPDFVARKKGEQNVEYPDPRVESILAETYGIMVYQEQVMQMAQIVGGYTLGGADLLRRAMGKKKPAEMARHRELFREGADKNGLSANQAEAIFDLMEKFAGYGFNKSHATAYALVAYQTAWLKTHYPAEFMAATLSADMDNTDKVVGLLQDTRAMGIEVLPPDVNASSWAFVALPDGRIRYGLGAIKGVGRGACEAIVEARMRGYRNLPDLCSRVDSSRLNKRVFEALIQAGAMDSLGAHRAALMAQLPEAVRAAEQASRDRESGQGDIFGLRTTGGSAGAGVALPEIAPWPPEELLAFERASLGHYFSGHPTDAWQSLLRQLATCPLGEIAEHYSAPPSSAERRRPPEVPWVVAGIVAETRKRGENMAFVRIEDASGFVEVSLFSEAWLQYSELITRDALLVVAGGLTPDSFNGGYQLRARKVWTLNQACAAHARLLGLDLADPDPDFPGQLARLLDAHPGTTPVLLRGYRNDGASTDLELPGRRVQASTELIRELEQLQGIAAVHLALSRPATD